MTVRPPVARVVLLILSLLFLSPFPQCTRVNKSDGVLLRCVLLGCADDMGARKLSLARDGRYCTL